MLNYIHYQTIGKAIDDTSLYFSRYRCGDCGKKDLKNKYCKKCENNKHFHNINCVSSFFRKIFKCNKCNFNKCNIKYNRLSKTIS